MHEQVSKGQIVPSTQNSAKKPAYDFYVGQDCIPTVIYAAYFIYGQSVQSMQHSFSGRKLEQSGLREP
jgi:hypothetical protein